MADKLKKIPNDDTQITPTTVDFNYWLKRLNIQLNERNNQNPIKVPKVVDPTNMKALL